MSTEPAHVTIDRWINNGILAALSQLQMAGTILRIPRTGGYFSDGWIVELGHGGLSVTVRFKDTDGVERGKNIGTVTLITHNPSLFPADK